MTSWHLATLFFEERKEAAKKRIQKLKAAGLVGERRRKPYEPSVLFLTNEAFRLLKSQGALATYPQSSLSNLDQRTHVSDLTMRHELEVMDVKAAFHSALRKSKVHSIAEFSTWPALFQFEASRGLGTGKVVVKPDGFIRINAENTHNRFEHTFFLEVDRSTEALEILAARGRCYLNYYKSGTFAERKGVSHLNYRSYPFRVLMVFKTSERRNNMAERLLNNYPRVLTQAYLSTIEEVKSDPLGPIWIRPEDYEKGIFGTAFRLSDCRIKCKRQSGRDVFVENRVQKVCLLGDCHVNSVHLPSGDSDKMSCYDVFGGSHQHGSMGKGPQIRKHYAKGKAGP